MKIAIRITTVFCLLLAVSLAHAQQISISGTVLDSAEIALPGASVMLVTEAEEELESFGITNEDGFFELYTGAEGSFVLKITIIGYGTFARKLNLVKGENNALGTITLRTQTYELDGVTIEDSFVPIVISKDTITYAADAFRTEEDATVEDLLKKLPGIEVDADGNIKAQGEDVEKILVDGKEFFEDDPKIASQNIPADVVDKVQVFDKKSDFTEFTGIDDGDEMKTINLMIKEGKNKGWFGTAEAEYGLDNRYDGGLNLNRFDKNMQLSFLGNSNNINNQPFTIRDYLDFTGAFEDVMDGSFDRSELPTDILNKNGVSNTHSAGLNFNYDFGENTRLRSNYFFNYADNLTLTESTSDNLLGRSSFLNNSDADNTSTLGSHRVSVKLKHSIDSSQDLSLQFRGSFTETDALKKLFTESFSNDSLQNSSASNSNSESTQNGWAADFSWRKRLGKKGRFLTADAELDKGFTNTSTLFYNQIQFFNPLPSTQTTDQDQRINSDELGYGVEINYVEPLGVGKYMNFKAARSNSQSDRLKLFLDQLDPYAEIVNQDLTSNFSRKLDRSVLGTQFKYVKPKFNFSLGTDFQLLELDNEDLIDQSLLQKNYFNVLPNARFSYSISNSSEFSGTYRSSVNIPTIEQLQPVIDNSDPLNIYQGNPDLIPEFTQNLNIRYRNFNQFYLRAFFAGISAQYTINRITDAEVINEEFVSIRTPENSDAEWRTTGYYNYSSPIRAANLQFRVDGSIALLKTNVLLNDVLDRTLFTTFSQKVTLENKKKKVLDVSGSIRIADNYTAYKLNNAQNQNFFDYSLTGRVAFTFAKNWNFRINSEYQQYLETDFSEGRDFIFLSARFSRYLLDKQLILYVRGENLFDENAGVVFSSAANQNTQQVSNRIGRLLMVGATYKIRAFGK